MTHGGRGKTLERAIRKLFESYDSRGIHCQQNHPEQLHDGTLVHNHGFDFQIFYKGKFIAFDAKECKSNTWPMDKVKPHQLKALHTVKTNGGDAFFLVWFTTLNKIVKVDPFKVELIASMGGKHISPEDGEETTINILGIQ